MFTCCRALLISGCTRLPMRITLQLPGGGGTNIWSKTAWNWKNLDPQWAGIPRASLRSATVKGLFTPNDSITVTVMLTSGTFDLFDAHCDRQNGLHTHFAHQCNIFYGDGDGVTWCEHAWYPLPCKNCLQKYGIHSQCPDFANISVTTHTAKEINGWQKC